MKKKIISSLLTTFMIFSLTSGVYAANENTQPNIYGKSAITLDMDTGEIIYAKSPYDKMYPASTTKLITSLLLAENKSKDDDLTYTKDAKAQPEYSLNKNLHPIDIGETMKASDAMDGLLLYSGNDVAYLIGDNVGGNREGFAKLMNDKAKSLNLKNSHFVNPNGLHDKNHYTTAYDLSILGRAAYKNPWVSETMAKKTSSISTSKGTTFLIENRNKLVGTKGCVGGKTGYTSAAGRCLVAIFDRDGRKILGVVLNSVYDAKDSFVFNDMEKIIDWSYKAEKTILHNKDSVIDTKTVSYRPLLFMGPVKTIDVPLTVKEDITYYNNVINKSELKESISLNSENPWKLTKSDSVGKLTVKEREAKKEYKLYSNLSKGTIFKENILLYLATFIIIIVLLVAIISIIRFINKRKRRNRRNRYI
ncbi:D-alanyl-D-alanine carboxypeptidase family protein [Clostridium cochlearium]